MVKGGFQGLDISGVDLTAQSPTLPGAYAACDGADGKPIRVQTADGQVECSVKKVSTNYVLAGITGEGKILSIVVSGTDGIDVSESEIPSGAEPDYKVGTAVDISNTTIATAFTVPKDGLITGYVASGQTPAANGFIHANNGGTTGAQTILFTIPKDFKARMSTFVKKGCKIWVENGGEAIKVGYKPFDEV